MKKYIVIFLFIMCMSTFMSGFTTPPQPMMVGIDEITTAKTNNNAADGLVGEVKIVDGYRNYTYPGAVTDEKT